MGEIYILVDIRKSTKIDFMDQTVFILQDSAGKIRQTNLQHTSGWIVLDEVKNIQSNTKISRDHINFLKDCERGL